MLPTLHIKLLKYSPTNFDASPNKVENPPFKSNDDLDKIIDVSKLLAQLLNAKVVLEKVEESSIKSTRQIPALTRSVSVHTNLDVDGENDVASETNRKDYTYYCVKCEKTVFACIKDSKVKNCFDCKTAMTYLCTKCNVKHYKRYSFLKFHWNRCHGNITSYDKSNGVDQNELNVADTSTVDMLERIDGVDRTELSIVDTNIAEGHNNSLVILDKNPFIVKKIDSGKWMNKLVRYCSKCDKVIGKQGPCSTCGKSVLYACKKCNAKYDAKRSIKYHLESKCYPANEYKCTHCKYTANMWDKMHKHFQYMHTERPKFRCNLCSYNTKSKSSLKIHLRRIHLDPIVLNIEDRITADVDGNHLSVKQNRDKNLFYKYVRYCSECDVVMKRHHISRCNTCNKNLQYACKKCNAKYKSSQSMFYHLKSQCYPTSEYKCMHCNYTTNTKIKMRKHFEGMHTDQPTLFKCKSCPYETKYRSNLTKHMKKCDRSKVAKIKFYCDNCNYSTNIERILRLHKKLRH